MARPLSKELTDRELEVMHAFWRRGETTASDARDELAARGHELAYVTVANLTRILVEKGFLEPTNQQRPFRYRAVRSFEEVSRSLLGDLVERVNREGSHGFEFDYSYDADGHPSNFYCRSDHANYARYGIPVTFFSTGSHTDYHQLTDETQYIDYEKLARVTRFIADVTVAVGDMDRRPAVDKGKPDPQAPCRQ